MLVARHGWCEPSCTRCGQVCPTGAIAPLTPETKGWTLRRGERHAGQDRHRLLRLGPLPALGDGDAVRRLRGGLPDEPEGHLAGGRGRAARGRHPRARAEAAPRARPLHRVRPVRGKVPGRVPGRDPRHARRGVPRPTKRFHPREAVMTRVDVTERSTYCLAFIEDEHLYTVLQSSRYRRLPDSGGIPADPAVVPGIFSLPASLSSVLFSCTQGRRSPLQAHCRQISNI